MSAPPRTAPQGARALHFPAFRALWASETLSASAQQVTVLTLPLLAVTALQATPAQMGVLAALTSVPILVFSLYAGVLVDRVPRVRLMALVCLGHALLAAGLIALILTRALSLEALYGLAFAVGALGVVYNVAYQSVVPELVSADALADANAKLETSRSGAEVLGPGVAGWLLGVLGGGLTVGLNAVMYLGSAAALARVSGRERRREPAPRPPLARHLGEGFRYVLRHPVIRPLMLCAATLNLAQGVLDAVLIYFLSKNLGLTPAQVGLVFMGSNAGFLCGALFGERLARRLGIGRSALLAAALAGAGLLLLPCAVLVASAWTVPLLMAARFVFGFGELLFYVQHITLRQAVTHEALQGRMHAVIRFLAGGMFPVGAVLGGWVGQRLGGPGALLVAGVVGSLGTLWIVCSGVPRIVRAPTSPAHLAAGAPESALPGGPA